MSFLFDSKNQKPSELSFEEQNIFIIIDVTWDDISNSIPYSETNSCLNYAFKRNGYNVLCKKHFVELSDGTVWYPEKISDHWRMYVSSPKIKPKTIKYFKF